MVHGHDMRYKKVFENHLFVEKLLKSFVHEDFVQHLDFTNMESLDKSFIDDNYKETESDKIYKIGYKNREIFIYLLMEFQSTSDSTMPLRFLRYLLELSETYKRNSTTKLYPVVFPLLIYNGNEKWNAKINVKDLFEKTIPEKYIPQFEYYPIIINNIPQNALRKIHNAVSAMFYLENSDLAKYSKHAGILIDMLHDVLPEEMKIFSIWFNSILEEKKLDIPQEELKKIYRTTEGISMFAANLDKVLNDSLERGIEQGIEQGEKIGKKETALVMKSDGLPIETIMKYTNLTRDEIEKL